ncbi:NDR1/HIN1-like protein 26 [Camellia sinensis]|uniref:NDR1/HIN1-like protein 26 n=1 Tax=Camellia sinensis TaxID=4442 RepID=UPI001036A1BD|nr:NDR1/HIN1-like protein 26 [Camellia sinensis]
MHPSQNQIQIQGTRNDRQYGQPHMTKDDGQYGQPHKTHDDRQYGQPHMTKDNRQYGQPHMTHDDRQYRRHKTTRYYVHRVRESLTTRISKIVIGIHYDAMQVTLYYQDQAIGKTFLLFPFYQKPKNTTVLYGVLSGATLTVNSNRWMQFQNDRDQGVVVFRLQVTSTIRFKVSKWDSKHHKMHANCEAGVGPDGSILANYKDKRCPVYFT